MASGEFPAGRQLLAWRAMGGAGEPLAAGTYFYRLRAEGASRTIYEKTLRLTIVR